MGDQLIQGSPELEEALQQGREIRESRVFWRDMATIGVLLVSIPTCYVVFKGPLSRGLCLFPFGLLFNSYMVYEAETRLRQAVEDMLLSPNGLVVLDHIDSLSDYQFNRNLEWYALTHRDRFARIEKRFYPLFKKP